MDEVRPRPAGRLAATLRLAGLVGLVLLVALLTIGATTLPAVLAGDDPGHAFRRVALILGPMAVVSSAVVVAGFLVAWLANRPDPSTHQPETAHQANE